MQQKGRSGSRLAPRFILLLRRRRRRWRGRNRPARLVRGAAEEAEELRAGPRAEARVVGAQSLLIGGHRAVEGKEVRVLAIGVGKQAVALGIAGAADLFSRRAGVRDDNGRLAIGLGPDFLRLLAALGAELGGLALTLGLHALINRLAVGLRQIGAANTHIDHLDAVAFR